MSPDKATQIKTHLMEILLNLNRLQKRLGFIYNVLSPPMVETVFFIFMLIWFEDVRRATGLEV